jgi:hypothetical protein
VSDGLVVEPAIVAVVCALASVVIAAWSASRAGRWRDSDEARAVDARLGKLEMDRTASDGRIRVLETRVDGEVVRLDGLIDRLELAVRRVEDMSRGS